jgi:hypothetical protein
VPHGGRPRARNSKRSYTLENIGETRTPIHVRRSFPAKTPCLPTVEDVWRTAASARTRSLGSRSGIVFEGTTTSRRILCAEDWEGHPLRKDYKSPEHLPRDQEQRDLTGTAMNAPHTNTPAAASTSDVRSEEMLLNMGPQHPSTGVPRGDPHRRRNRSNT